MEAEDDSIRSGSQRDVRFGNRAHRAMDDLQGDFLGFDFLERLDDGLDGSLSIGFDDQLENFVSGRFKLSEKVLERDLGARFLAKGFGLLSSLTGHLARGLFV